MRTLPKSGGDLAELHADFVFFQCSSNTRNSFSKKTGIQFSQLVSNSSLILAAVENRLCVKRGLDFLTLQTKAEQWNKNYLCLLSHNSWASCPEMSFRQQTDNRELRELPATHGCRSGSQLTPQVNDRLFRRRSCLETGVNKHKGATGRARKGVAVPIEHRVLPTLISFILLPFQPSTPSLAIFLFSFFTPHCNYTCSAKRSSRRGWAKSLVNMNLQRARGGGLLTHSLCGNIRL